MVRQRYVGIPYPEHEFRELRDLHTKLLHMQCRCRPFSPEYLVIQAVIRSLCDAAEHFTKDPHFYGGRAHTS